MCISILNIFISTRHVVTSTILLVCRGQWIHEIMGGFFQTMKCDYFVKFLYCCDVQQNQMIFYNKAWSWPEWCHFVVSHNLYLVEDPIILNYRKKRISWFDGNKTRGSLHFIVEFIASIIIYEKKVCNS